MSHNASNDRTEAIQAVVDRVSSYQEGAPGGTVAEELRSGLNEAGIDVDDHVIVALAEAIASGHSPVSVADVLS